MQDTTNTAFQPYLEPVYPSVAGLYVYIGAGSVASIGPTVSLPVTRLALPPNAITYIFINLATNTIQTNTSGFSGNVYPIAIASTNSLFVSNLTDARPDVFETVTGGGGGGSVTSVGTSGLASGGPITTVGTVNVAGSGGTNTAATAAANLGAAPSGDVLTSDGSGNVQDSGTALSSLAPKANPTFTGTVTASTLAATTIDGAALSGTFTGSPTLSGNPAFTGNPTFSNPLPSGIAGVTPAVTDRSTKLATTAAIYNAMAQIDATQYGCTGNGHFMFQAGGSNPAGPLIYFLTLSQVAVSGSTTTYTGTIVPNSAISHIVETAGNQVTLTVASGNWQPGQVVQLSGLTTGTWLNGQNVTLLPGTISTALLFTDPTSHGVQASHSETGTALINFTGYLFTVAGFTNSVNNVQITVTSNTTTTLVCTTASQTNETHAATAGGNTIDCYGALFSSVPNATVGQLVFATNLTIQGFTKNSVVTLPQGTITAINSDTQIVVSSTPTATNIGGVLVWGDDESTALSNAWAAVTASPSGGNLKLPEANPQGNGPAVILVQSPQLNATGLNNVGTGGVRAGWGVYGGGIDATFIVPTPGFSFGASTVGFLNVEDGLYAHDFAISGMGNGQPGSGLTAKSAVFFQCANNMNVRNLSLTSWGNGGANYIGTGMTVQSAGNAYFLNIDCDMFGHTNCQVSSANICVFDHCTFWDCSLYNFYISSNSVATPIVTNQCEFGNAGTTCVAVVGSSVWRDFGSVISLPNESNGNIITIGFDSSGSKVGTAYLIGTTIDSEDSNHVLYIDNSNCSVTAIGCLIKDESSQVAVLNNGTFVDIGNIIQSSGTIYSGTGTRVRYTGTVVTTDLTAQTAAISTTTLYSVPALSAGQYRVGWNAKITTVASTGATTSTLGALTIVYTDPDSTVQTITAAAQSAAGAIETSDTGNLTTTVLLGVPMVLNCKAGTNITYAMAYASNTAAQMAYNLHLRVEPM